MGFMLSSANLSDPPNDELFKKYPLDWTLDNVWEDEHGNIPSRAPIGQPKQCYLMTFIVGDSAKYWATQSRDDRARAVIQHVQRIYGLTNKDLFDSSDIVSNYKEYNWPAGGAESAPPGAVLIPAPDAMMGPNALSTLGWALRVPVGNIHWAGSESATEWNGYMSGAIQSGFRAAGEVLGFVRPLSRPSP
jgi:monoamine oxidase